MSTSGEDDQIIIGIDSQRLLEIAPWRMTTRRRAGWCSPARRATPVASVVFSACAARSASPCGIVRWRTMRPPGVVVSSPDADSAGCDVGGGRRLSGRRRPSWTTTGSPFKYLYCSGCGWWVSASYRSAPSVRRDSSTVACPVPPAPFFAPVVSRPLPRWRLRWCPGRGTAGLACILAVSRRVSGLRPRCMPMQCESLDPHRIVTRLPKPPCPNGNQVHRDTSCTPHAWPKSETLHRALLATPHGLARVNAACNAAFCARKRLLLIRTTT